MSIYLIEDEPEVAESLSWLFRSRNLSLEHFESAEAFLSMTEALPNWSNQASCILLDIRLRRMSGLELYERLRKQWRDAQGWLKDPIPVIFLSGHADIAIAVDVVKQGAFDFFEKPAPGNRLVDRSLEALQQSKERLSVGLIARETRDKLSVLSKREIDVARLVLTGRLNKQIADDLAISMRTVEVHRASIFAKMGVRSAVELARLLDSCGIVL